MRQYLGRYLANLRWGFSFPGAQKVWYLYKGIVSKHLILSCLKKWFITLNPPPPRPFSPGKLWDIPQYSLSHNVRCLKCFYRNFKNMKVEIILQILQATPKTLNFLPLLREAAKKIILLMAWPLRGEGGG